MKKTNLIKGFLIMLIGAVIIGTTGVYAADDDWGYVFDDDTSSTGTEENKNENKNENTNKNENSNKNENTNKNTNKNENTNKNTNKNTNNTNNSSNYNNANNTNNLPKTGVEDSIPTMVLIVVFGISAVYAYKKISEYKNV